MIPDSFFVLSYFDEKVRFGHDTHTKVHTIIHLWSAFLQFSDPGKDGFEKFDKNGKL